MTRYDVKTHIDNKEQILCNVVDCENSFETFRVDDSPAEFPINRVFRSLHKYGRSDICGQNLK